MEYLNCRHCRTRIEENAPFCPQCGAPNEPEPVPWYLSAGNRMKAAFAAKTKKSVWADRLASLMPIHFVASLIALIWIVTSLSALGNVALVAGIITFGAMMAVLVYYPGWYDSEPSKRMDYGLIYFVILVVHAIVIYNLTNLVH